MDMLMQVESETFNTDYLKDANTDKHLKIYTKQPNIE